MEAALARIPTALQPYVPHVVGIVCAVMGILAIASLNNQGLKDAIKGHIPWIIFGLLLLAGGATFFMGFRG